MQNMDESLNHYTIMKAARLKRLQIVWCSEKCKTTGTETNQWLSGLGKGGGSSL